MKGRAGAFSTKTEQEAKEIRWLKREQAEDSNITEQREQPSEGGDLLRALVSGEPISRDKAFAIPSFTACVEFISNTVAMLPVKLYKEQEGETQEVTDDIRVRLLNDETGDTLDSFAMKKAAVSDYLTEGDGYIYINKVGNRVRSLHYVNAANVSVVSGPDPIFKRNEVLVNGARYRDFEFIKLLRKSVDGGTGRGIINESGKILSVAYNSLVFEDNLVVNGGNKKGFLKANRKLAKEAFEELRLAWKRLYSNNENNMMLLNEGVDFIESSNSSVEMQLNENKRTNAEEICKLFGLSPKIISGQGSDEEYASAVKIAIIPILTAFETALNKELLLEKEKGELYFAFDTGELLKGDIEKRFRAYQIALSSNFLQIDEVRYMENKKPLGINWVRLGLQDVLYDPVTKEVYTPNMNATANLTKLKGGERIED